MPILSWQTTFTKVRHKKQHKKDHFFQKKSESELCGFRTPQISGKNGNLKLENNFLRGTFLKTTQKRPFFSKIIDVAKQNEPF